MSEFSYSGNFLAYSLGYKFKEIECKNENMQKILMDKIDKLQKTLDSLIEKIEFAPVDGAPEFEKAKEDWNERNKN